MSGLDAVILNVASKTLTAVENVSVGSDIASLYSLLRDINTTASDIETFSNTDVGYATWSSLNGLSFDISTNILTMIIDSTSAYNAIIGNSLLIKSFITNPKMLPIMAAKASYMSSLATTHLAAWAASLPAVQIIFNDYTARTILFDEGGKVAADALMRGDTHVQYWLNSIFSTESHEGTSKVTINKRAYLLWAGATSNTGSVYIGNFLGDYNTGEKSYGGLSAGAAVYERIFPITTRHTNSDRAVSIRYIPMEV